MDAGEETTALYEKRSNTATGSAFLLTYNVTSNMTKDVYARVYSKRSQTPFLYFN